MNLNLCYINSKQFIGTILNFMLIIFNNGEEVKKENSYISILLWFVNDLFLLYLIYQRLRLSFFLNTLSKKYQLPFIIVF